MRRTELSGDGVTWNAPGIPGEALCVWMLPVLRGRALHGSMKEGPHEFHFFRPACRVFPAGGLREEMSERILTQDAEALADYAATGSHAAFRRVVQSSMSLVMGTALRQTNGRRALAEDIAQIVFTDLARLAKSVRGATLSAWLYKHTCFTAAKQVRSERRRGVREQAAAENSGPAPEDDRSDLLDEILLSLAETDRAVLLLRYVEGRSHEEVAEALGISRAAAQKRSERAMARLRAVFHHGIGTGALTAVLAPPVADAADLAHHFSGPALGAAAGAKTLPFFTKPLAAVLWGTAAAVTLSAVPLAFAWRDYSIAKTAVDVRPVLAGKTPVVPAASFGGNPAARAPAFESPDAVVTALLEIADRFGMGEQSRLRANALIASLPPEWIHDVILTLDRRVPAVIRAMPWHSHVCVSLAERWKPRRVPEDLLAVQKAMPSSAPPDLMLPACIAADLPATLRYMETRGGLSVNFASAIITELLKTDPPRAVALFDQSPRIPWIGYMWEYAGQDALRKALKDPSLRQKLAEAAPSMRDLYRRVTLERLIWLHVPPQERQAKVEAVTDPQRRAEIATAAVLPTAESFAWWKTQVPPSRYAELGTAIAQTHMDKAPVRLGWLEDIGEPQGGAEFDRLRSMTVRSYGGNYDATAELPVSLANMAIRITDPALRAATLGDLLRIGKTSSRPWKPQWMQQHLTPAEQADFAAIANIPPTPP